MPVATEPTTPFQVEADTAAADLRRAVRRLLDALDPPPASAAAMERQLGIDRNLAWKLWRVASGADAAAVAPFIPGKAALEDALDAARRASVPARAVSRAREAFAHFREVVKRHATDRASGEIMLAAGAGGRTDGADLGLRRAAFRAMSTLAGVRVGDHVSAFFVAPGSQTDRIDIATVKGFYDIERIRRGAPFSMTRPRAAVGGSSYTSVMTLEPLEPPPGGGPLPLLADFCSTPPPRFIERVADEGFVEDELEDRPVGRQGLCTVVRASISRNLLPKYKSPDDQFAEVSMRLRTPCRDAWLYKFIHEDAYGPVSPELRIYNDLAGEAPWLRPDHERYVLPVKEKVEHLGRGLGALNAPAPTRFVDLAEHVFTRLAWNPGAFSVYRVRIELPLVPSTVMMVHAQMDRA